MVRVAARRDVAMRVRVVSEPVSDCIRYEHAGTAVDTAAGDDVRWLPRAQAVGLLLPVVDGDGPLGHPAGGAADGSRPGAAYAEAVETLWGRAVPHDQYKIR